MADRSAGQNPRDPDRQAAARRLAKALGDPLPDVTSDEIDDPRDQRTRTDDDYRAERPPHHG